MDESKQPTKSNWLFIVSPCLLAALICLYGIIDSYLDMGHSKGWSFIGVIILVPILVIVLVADLLLKYFLKGRTGLLWLIEIVLIAIIFLYQFRMYL